MGAIREGGRKYYLVNCKVCNKEMKVRDDYVAKHSGICISCQKKNNKQALKHGSYKTRLYRIWLGLKHRRYTAGNPLVCEEWKEFENFKKWALDNGYNDSLTIDRMDSKGNYEPANCQWITHEENSAKDKRIFSKEECVEIYKQRKQMGLTQKEMATLLNVSRNTIQRAEKSAKECM
jgi:DNA-binding transcriptional regulator YiaG